MLRKRGLSLKEISENLRVSKSTTSLWVRDVVLDRKAEERLLDKIKLGRFLSAKRKSERTKAIEQRYFEEAKRELKSKDKSWEKVVCAMLYWCEGAKNPKSGMAFTNSDPALIEKFLALLRKSFPLNEAKFRPCLHIHSYHSSEKLLDFWSKVTHINKRQFIKPYRKTNNGKRIHDSYQGCLSLRYHSNDLARRLISIAKAFLDEKGA